MLRVLSRIWHNLDDFLFGVLSVIVGFAAYEYAVKPYVIKKFLKR